MIPYTEYTTTKIDGGKTKKQHKWYSNVIFTFDIETTSYVVDLEGNCHQPFNDIPTEWSKQSLCYHWQFGINEDVYSGRTLQEFKEFLTKIRPDIEGIPIIYIHNLSFESQHLINIFDDLEMFARKPHHPIKAYSPSLEVEFRCTYFLFNMKLENVAKNYNLPHQKSKDLDYKLFRSPLTPLTPEELNYCELDCLILYDAIKMKCEQYGSPAKIPLTQTGQVRESTKKLFVGQQGMHYYKKLWKMIPQNYEEYYILRQCFQGGWTHANAVRTEVLHKNVSSYDIASSYPTQLCLKKYPMSKFYKSSVRDFSQIDSNMAYIFRIRFDMLESSTWNTYLSSSHCVRLRNGVYDNGRVVSADVYECWCTDVDLEIIRKCYDFKGYEIESAYVAKKGYLDIRFVNFILDLYVGKTSLKGVNQELYQRSKEQLNSCYGMCVTDIIRDEVEFVGDEWRIIPLTTTDITDKLQRQKGWGKAFLSYAWGVWCTAYARKQLWDAILELDYNVVYCDTDSVKFLGETDFFDKYNEQILKQHEYISQIRDIPLEKFRPKDPKGVEHPLGVFDFEGVYKEFKTLGAKRYCYKDKDGIHITVAGVSKTEGVKAIKCVDDFRDGLYFDVDQSGKAIAFYNSTQKEVTLYDINNVPYKCTDKYGICIAPTTYKLTMTPQYIDYLQSEQLKASTRISLFEDVDFGKDIY